MSSVRAGSTDEIRLQNYRAQVERQHDAALQQLDTKYREQIGDLIQRREDEIDQIRRAYDVRISEEAEQLEAKLHSAREIAMERVAQEQKSGDKEVERIRTIQNKRVEEYKKNAYARADDVHRELEQHLKNLDTQAKRSERLKLEAQRK